MEKDETVGELVATNSMLTRLLSEIAGLQSDPGAWLRSFESACRTDADRAIRTLTDKEPSRAKEQHAGAEATFSWIIGQARKHAGVDEEGLPRRDPGTPSRWLPDR